MDDWISVNIYCRSLYKMFQNFGLHCISECEQKTVSPVNNVWCCSISAMVYCLPWCLHSKHDTFGFPPVLSCQEFFTTSENCINDVCMCQWSFQYCMTRPTVWPTRWNELKVQRDPWPHSLSWIGFNMIRTSAMSSECGLAGSGNT